MLARACLYLFPVPIPIVEGITEAIDFELRGSPVAFSSFAFGTETVP